MPAPFSPLTSQRLRPSATTTTLTGGHYAAPVPSVSVVVRMRGLMMKIVPRFATTDCQANWERFGSVVSDRPSDLLIPGPGPGFGSGL